MNKRKLICILAFLVLAVPCAARTITVDDDGLADYNNIQAAIDDSNDGDIIEVQPGTYTGDGNRDIDFGGRAITVRGIDPNDPNIVATTIIDCNGTIEEQHRGFYFHSGEDGNSVLDGFTITNGYASGRWPEGAGGGIYCNNSSPTVRNCEFTDNSADGGGAIYCERSSPTIANCTLSGNKAAVAGGGMLNFVECRPVLTNCTFSGNHADLLGGGMCNDARSSLVLTNCTFYGNEAGSGGGIISHMRCSMTLTNCIFRGNRAGSVGGGMSCMDSSLTITNCTFSRNSASQHGGGMFNLFTNSALTNCAFSGNSAGQDGGGMYNEYSRVSILTNCTFAGNLAANGNALACDSYKHKYPSTVELANCILWDGGEEIWNNDNSTITITYSCVQGADPNDPNAHLGVGNIDADPSFAEPGYWADANDPNIVVEPNDPNAVWVEGDYHLLPDSPCIDAGDNNSLPADIVDLDGDGNTTEPIPWDLDGELRFVDDPCTPDTGNGTPPIVDMGAFEFQLLGPIDLLLGLMERVFDLNLPHGIANSLAAKLDAALKLLEDGNDNNDVAAINLLQAFINAVEAQRGKKIPEADADDMIDSVQGIIAMLSGT